MIPEGDWSELVSVSLQRKRRRKRRPPTVVFGPVGERHGALATVQGEAKRLRGRIALPKIRKIRVITRCRGRHVDGELCVGSVRKRRLTRVGVI